MMFVLSHGSIRTRNSEGIEGTGQTSSLFLTVKGAEWNDIIRSLISLDDSGSKRRPANKDDARYDIIPTTLYLRPHLRKRRTTTTTKNENSINSQSASG